MVSLTTRLCPRTFLAVQSLAKKANKTESAWLREFIENSVDVHTEPVPEEDINALTIALGLECQGRSKKSRKNPWYKFW